MQKNVRDGGVKIAAVIAISFVACGASAQSIDTQGPKAADASELRFTKDQTILRKQASGASGGDTEGGAADLAKQLSNPIASLISVPFQFNYDTGYGDEDTDRWTLNVQPVIPFRLSEDWNLISRTIIPFIDAEVPGPGGDETGLGDIVQSFFFSPAAPTSGGWIWGVGPVLLLPTGKDDFTADQWGAGPTAVALRQIDGWTYGGLINHIWGFDADDGREEISATFLQPFLSYTTPDAWTFTMNTESTYDWNSEDWNVPLNVSVSKLTKIGNQPISLQGTYRAYLDTPDGGPDWGLRFTMTFLFPE